ncbi:MAG: MBL fold metallo-hydrolase [Promethearchaeota archaeon]
MWLTPKWVENTLTIIQYIIFFFLLLLFGGFIYFLKQLHLVSTGKISVADPNVKIYAIKKILVNFYLIQKGETLIGIDTGFGKFPHKEFHKIKLHPKAVSAVLLTHSDFDHAGGVNYFPNATIYLAKDEIPMTDGTKFRKFFVKNKSLRTRSFQPLENGKVLHINDLSIQIILTPGHTPGSACYLVEGKYLFTGDSLRFKHQKIHPFYRIINMNTKLQRRSLDKLKTFLIQHPDIVIFTAHGGISYENS